LLTLHGQEHNRVVSGHGEVTRLVIVVELLVFNEDAGLIAWSDRSLDITLDVVEHR
jgi:hypothetical protein